MKVIAKESALSVVGWIGHGDVLPVLAIHSGGPEGARFLLWSKLQNAAALFPAIDFLVVDASISFAWVASIEDGGHIYLAPPDWHAEDFWELYYSGDENAELQFSKGVDLSS